MFKVLDVARGALGSVAKVAAKVPIVENKYRMNARLNGPWPKGPFLWLHGASLGECKMLMNLAKLLKDTKFINIYVRCEKMLPVD